MQVQAKEMAHFPLYSLWDYFSSKKSKMHFKLDVMKTLDADNAFSWQSMSRVLHSRSQIPWKQREVTAENLRFAGNWYQILEFTGHIIDSILKQTNRKYKIK